MAIHNSWSLLAEGKVLVQGLVAASAPYSIQQQVCASSPRFTTLSFSKLGKTAVALNYVVFVVPVFRAVLGGG